MGQCRLDTRLVEAGLVPTRSKARDLVRRGYVRVNGVVCEKPGQSWAENARIEVADNAPKYVSRGAEKLAAALDQFNFSPDGLIALDVGASTGGFTEILLERGAKRVYAIDVGQGQLHPRLRDDDRVVSLEKCDARRLDVALVPDAPQMIVADVSFISLTKVLGPSLSLAQPGAMLVALVKPQFEAGRDAIGRGGIVRDEAARAAVLASLSQWLEDTEGWTIVETMPSPILGGSGNTEYLIGARRNG